MKGKSNSALREAKPLPQNGSMLLDLGADLVRATLVRRPSSRNKSPWVADVKLATGRIALAHVPAMDMGGLCVEGSVLLLKPAVDGKGKLIGSKATGPYGTPKCEFIIQLVHVKEPENKMWGECWCAGHPSLGEKLAAQLLERGMVSELAAPTVSLQREVSGIAGCDMRADFLVSHKNGSRSVLEVKTVLNTDYDPKTKPDRKECVYVGKTTPYQRAGIFPWGRVAQAGPNGEKVVSARAIKHIRELAKISSGKAKSKIPLHSMLLFVVVRHDVKFMRVNEESCPSFARYAKLAQAAGVKFAAHRVRWGVGKDLGKAFWEGPIKVKFPS